MTCDTCGQDHPSCIGHVTKDPETRDPITPRPCRKPAMKDQQVCATHGGKSPNALAAAEERRAQAKADALVTDLWTKLTDAAPVTDPLAAMLQLAGSLERMVDALGVRVNALKTVEAGEYRAQLRAVFIAFEKVTRQYQTVLSEINRLGLAQQLVRLEEDKARLVAVAFQEGLDAIGADAEARVLFTRVVMGRLRVVEGSGRQVPALEAGGPA